MSDTSQNQEGSRELAEYFDGLADRISSNAPSRTVNALRTAAQTARDDAVRLEPPAG